jgi:hypothetical protein
LFGDKIITTRFRAGQRFSRSLPELFHPLPLILPCSFKLGQALFSGQVLVMGSLMNFPLVDSDFENVRRHLGAGLSCEKMATIINEMPAMKRCCIKVNCEMKPTSMGLSGSPGNLLSTEIPAGMPISEIFR